MRATGSNVVVRMAQEATWGTVNPSPAHVYQVGFKSFTLKGAKGTFESEMINAQRCTIGIGDGNNTVDGNLVSDLLPEGLELFIMHALGNPTVTTTGSGPYTHVMKGTPGFFQGLTLEKGFTDIGKFFSYTGCRVNTMQVNLVQEGLHEVTFGFIGKEESDPADATFLSGTPLSFTKNGFSGYNVVLYTTMNDSGVITPGSYHALGFVPSGSFSINNNIETDGFVMGSDSRASAQLGKRACSGEFTTFFENTYIYQLYKDCQELGIKFVFDNDQGQTMSFEFPCVKLGGNTPEVQNFQGLNLPLSFTAKYDSTAGTDVIVTIQNTLATLEAGL